MIEAQDTSREAHEHVKPRKVTLRERVLRYVVGCGEHGATDEEMQTALGMDPNTQRPRRRELVQAGYIVDSGKRRETRTGRNAIVWISRDLLEDPRQQELFA